MTPELQILLSKAKAAEKDALALTSAQKNQLLHDIAQNLIAHTDAIIAANRRDLDNARDNGISDAMRDRLMLNAPRIQAIADSLQTVIDLPDPVGEIIETFSRPNGLVITKKRVPIGVVGIIYEARPNVTVDAAALCIKSGNVSVLRGGKEAIHTNLTLADLMRQTLRDHGVSTAILNLIPDTSRESTHALMQATAYVDVLIPRGGKNLIQSVKQNARVPVIETGAGNCHLYVDRTADLSMAVNVTDNAKTSRPSVCNAAETLLVHRDVAAKFLPMVKKKLDEHRVVWYACPLCMEILGQAQNLLPAAEADYFTEYNDYCITVKVVNSIEQAVEHINHYSTKHSEAILTQDAAAAEYFTNTVRSAVVYVNASTRFTDGGEFGFGAEIGISTGKLHARGPMGLRELTTTQYVVTGNGQTR